MVGRSVTLLNPWLKNATAPIWVACLGAPGVEAKARRMVHKQVSPVIVQGAA